MPRSVHEVAHAQAGVISRVQLVAAGVTVRSIATDVSAGRWQRLHPGIVAMFTGPLPRVTELWAALLACGAGATLGHRTALEMAGVFDVLGGRIDVSVPGRRHIKAPAGVSVFRSVRLDMARHPVARPPRTRVDESVVDVIDGASTEDSVIDVITRACQRRRTTAERIRLAIALRSRLRWRSLALEILADVDGGIHSPLERRYLRIVEWGHGLPPAERNRPEHLTGRRVYRDVR
jgi:hypothetical protein